MPTHYAIHGQWWSILKTHLSKINNLVDKILHFADFTMVSSWKFYTVTFKAIAQFGQGFYIAKAVLILAKV